MTKTHTTLTIAIATVLLMTSFSQINTAHAASTLVGFESLAVGSSVEGLGAVNADLNISSSGTAKIIREGDPTGATYGAPNIGSVLNNCLDGEQGFADTTRNHVYDFDFGGKTVSEFSLLMLDFGDLNNDHTTNHLVRVTAFDIDNNVVDTDDLTYTSSTLTNPRLAGSSAGDLYHTGDACDASPQQPGNYKFTVSGSGIVRVEFRVLEGIDRNIGFDNVEFTLEPIEPECVVESSTINLIAGQHTDSGDVEITNDGENLIITITTQDGWSLSESHVSVQASVDDIPHTKKGNPIPGQFEYSQSYDPNVTEAQYIIPLDGLPEDLTIAVHTVVQQIVDDVVAEETAWAEGDRFVQKGNWGMYTEYGLQCLE